jgi:hypothetical protein
MSNTIKEENKSEEYPQEIEYYKPIRIIGRGSYASIYEAIVLVGPHKNEHIAVKEITLDKLNLKKYDNFKVSKNYIY